jgi:hypothetical protein
VAVVAVQWGPFGVPRDHVRLMQGRSGFSLSEVEYGMGGFTVLTEDLLAALRELLEASSVMTSGELPTAAQLDRYKHAREWAQRLLDRQAQE